MPPSAASRKPPTLVVDPRPRFDLSKHLYMQFMEPLGATDGSVEASWDYRRNDWREDLVKVTKALGPTMIRWGGCFASYYRWREGVGPRARRVPMHNLLWRGMETNQVGTHEFVGFCRRVKADPLMVVNFESDGRMHWSRPWKGQNRLGTAREAAEWVDYCNSPRNRERRANGAREPLRIDYWQIGNETSYDRKGFDCETAAVRTVKFAKAMRRADPTIRLIGWGDSGWAPRMLEVAGEHLDYIAFHSGYRSTLSKRPPFADGQFQRDFAETWRHLMTGAASGERKLRERRAEIEPYGVPMAITESHYGFPGPHRGRLLSTWAVGVAYARIFNMYQRHGDLLKILTLADFAGTRWSNNAIILPVPGERGAYMQPVARVMQLFRHHTGRKAAGVRKAPKDLDVTASRTGGRVWLHVANTNRTRPVTARIGVAGMGIAAGEVFEIAEDPRLEIWRANADRLEPVRRRLGASHEWRFPPASVSAVELTVRPEGGRS